jgi:hypothetical protein
MGWFRRRTNRAEGQQWYVATVRRADGREVDVPFKTAAQGRRPLRRKADIAVRREGYLDAEVIRVVRKPG